MGNRAREYPISGRDEARAAVVDAPTRGGFDVEPANHEHDPRRRAQAVYGKGRHSWHKADG